MDKFRDVAIGQSFDWIGGAYPSFFKRCTKTSARTYYDEDGHKHSVGSINAVVYHVTPTDFPGFTTEQIIAGLTKPAC